MAKKKLQSLTDFNSERFQHHNLTNQDKRLNGIECPNCEQELYDTNPMMTLTSNPPKKSIHCENCDYSGYRLA